MKKIYNIHPLLIALYPILSLYNHNKEIIKLSQLFWPIIISLLAVILFYILLKIFIKNKNKTAASTSFFIILFFITGHYLNFMAPFIKPVFFYILLLAFLLIYIVAVAFIISSKRNFNILSTYLNTVSIILIIFPLISITLYEYKQKDISENNSIAENIENNNAENLPDIYYIILDGYARSDVLKEIYNYDNSDFVNYLNNKGFYVAGQSAANYPQTFFSMSSSLNYEYVNYLSEIVGENSDNRRPLKNLIKNHKSYEVLKKNGYKFVTLPVSWTGLYKNQHSDIHIDNTYDINSFDKMLINITPLSFFLSDKIASRFNRDKILFNYDNLSKVAELELPTFTYVHFLNPHPPFVFDQYGNNYKHIGIQLGHDGDHYFKHHPDREEYKERYINAVIFNSNKTKIMIDEIIAKSETPPIIILQSDHGPGLNTIWDEPEKTNMKERLSILNAYYLPEEAKENLYETITPVNSFRIIFNYLFNDNLELLEDKSYFNTWDKPYKFIDVTENLINS